MTKFNFTSPAFGYEDVYIIPQYSEIASRKHVDTSYTAVEDRRPIHLDVPVVSANMDTVTGKEMCVALAKAGAMGALHRFMTIEENANDVREIVNALKPICGTSAAFKFMVSVGVGPEALRRAEALYDAGARVFVIDIAHGHSLLMKNMIADMREAFGFEIYIVAGNVATAEGAVDLAKWGADAVKAGVGPGCFAAGTRVLMANGEYKNIELIRPGDRVINKDGNPVSVRGVESKGIRQVGKYRTNTSGRWTVCTPDHLHWVGDLSSTNQKTISASGYAKVLDKQSKTTPKQSKYKWMEISEASKEKTVCLMPKNIKFELPKTFLFDLYKTNVYTKEKENYASLTPTYELGYIFGTFLGDGHARSVYNKKRKSKSGSVSWFFGSNELDIVNKLTSCIEKTFNRNAKINTPKNKNIIQVNFYDKPFAEFLVQFGKRQHKNLPIEFLVDNTEYLQGLFAGLVDSDGCVSNSGRIKFGNTSESLAELFCVLNIILEKHVPNFETRKPTMGGLKGTCINNVQTSFAVRPLLAPKNRMTKEYQVVKILDSDFSRLAEREVFDIEVDDATQSFIANNSIVHNSVCSTKNVTGVTVPQFTVVQEIAEALKRFNPDVCLIADGGIREIGDIAKALGAGAHMVMCGKMFAGCRESPGERIDGKKIYRGSSSADVNKIVKKTEDLPTPEGISVLVQTEETPASELIHKIKGGLQSSFSYSNAGNLMEFHTRCMFGVRHNR